MTRCSSQIDWSKVEVTHVKEVCSRYDSRDRRPKQEVYMITYDNLKVLTP